MPSLRLGLILNRDFHFQNRWVSALTPRLVEGVLRRFHCCWIQTQQEYESCLGDVDALLSMEPGWAAPRLEFGRTAPLREKLASLPSCILYSDPHDKSWREEYFLENRLDYVLAYYDVPTRRHFRRIPAERIVHFPWAVPDESIAGEPIRLRSHRKIACFGASSHEAYELRNWCRAFPFVDSTTNSGVENKAMKDDEYFRWLATRDAAIAAGSDSERYRLTVPKYFEIPAAGALLLAQETEDLETLGFRDRHNCIVFHRGNFESLAREYLNHPQDFLAIREAGRELIRSRHAISTRLDALEGLLEQSRERKRGTAASIPDGHSVGNGPGRGRRQSQPQPDAEPGFDFWFEKICAPDLVRLSRESALLWKGRPLAWEVCHEILAYNRFCRGAISPESLIELSNARYGLLDRLWPGPAAGKEELDRYYRKSAEIVPWGHGVFLADHEVEERRSNWMRRVAVLKELASLGARSVADYGAGGGHTSLLAAAMGFRRVVHHEYPVFHPFVLWRADAMEFPGGCAGRQAFEVSDAQEAMSLAIPVESTICMDVAEHVFDPDAMLEEIRHSLVPGGILAWVAMFGVGISCHLHGHLRGHEDDLLARHGFERIGPLKVPYQGHTGLYRACGLRSAASGPVSAHRGNLRREEGSW